MHQGRRTGALNAGVAPPARAPPPEKKSAAIQKSSSSSSTSMSLRISLITDSESAAALRGDTCAIKPLTIA